VLRRRGNGKGRGKYNRKCNGKYKAAVTADTTANGNGKSKSKDKSEMRGFFASLRMTSVVLLASLKGSDNSRSLRDDKKNGRLRSKYKYNCKCGSACRCWGECGGC